jgi:hypothetical protein
MTKEKEVVSAPSATEARPQRRERIPVSGPRDILTVAEKDPNYVYRWVKDLPGRIQRFRDAGYEIVNHETQVGQRTVDSASRLGTAVTRLDGTNTLVLMRIPKEWYDEDQTAKATVLNAQEQALRGEGLKTERTDKWQPGEGFAGRKADK